MNYLLKCLCLGLLIIIPDSAKFALEKSIPCSPALFSTDNLGNVYFTNDNILKKYNPEGNLMQTYSSNLYGAISQIDVTNPLKIILFYEPFQHITILDNTLSPIGKDLLLTESGYTQVSPVCSSSNAGLWIYNKQNFELLHLDQDHQIISRTGNIAQQTGKDINPNFLVEKNNKIFLNDPALGILVFDLFGAYYKTIFIYGLYRFQVSNNNIIYYQKGRLLSYNFLLNSESEIILPDSTAKDARSEKEKLYLLKEKSIDIYSVKN